MNENEIKEILNNLFEPEKIKQRNEIQEKIMSIRLEKVIKSDLKEFRERVLQFKNEYEKIKQKHGENEC